MHEACKRFDEIQTPACVAHCVAHCVDMEQTHVSIRVDFKLPHWLPSRVTVMNWGGGDDNLLSVCFRSRHLAAEA